MPLENNNGTYYYEIPTGVSSDVDLDVESNNGSRYYFKVANDYILWTQPDYYPHTQTNNGTEYYFYQSNVPSDPNLDITANNGSKFYYKSEFDVVSFAGGDDFILAPNLDDPPPDEGFVFVFTADDEQVFDQDDNAVQVLDIYANS